MNSATHNNSFFRGYKMLKKYDIAVVIWNIRFEEDCDYGGGK